MRKLQLGDTCKNGHVLSADTVQYVSIPGGVRMRCKICQRAAVDRHRAAGGAEKNRKQRRVMYYANLEAARHKSRLSKREEYRRNREKILRRAAAWRHRNIEAVRDRQWQWRQNPQNRLYQNISRAIRFSIGHDKAGRKWEAIVGYGLDRLCAHLESQFTEGMSWDNYGQWEIDHIKPRAAFDFTDDGVVVEAWSLDNLQPLWRADNRRKWAYYGGAA